MFLFIEKKIKKIDFFLLTFKKKYNIIYYIKLKKGFII